MMNGLKLKVWLHPWLDIAVLAAVVLFVVLMALDPANAPRSGRASARLRCSAYWTLTAAEAP